VLNQEVACKQTQLAGVVGLSDSLCHGLALEGGIAIKNRVQALKANLTSLGDASRLQANSVSDIIFER